MIGVVPCTDPSVAVEDPRRSDIASGTLVSSPAPIVSGGVHGSVTPHRQMLRRSVGGDGAGVREEEGREGALGLRTPASVLHRDVDMDGVDGGRRAGHTDPNSIIRTPQRQKGFFDYLAATFSN